MRNLPAFLFVAVFFVGCSSEAKVVDNSPAKKGTPTPGQNTNLTSNSPILLNPGQLVNLDANNSNANSLNAKSAPTITEIREKIRQKALADQKSAGPAGPPPPPQFKPAAENSVIATAMDGSGAVVETRIFKSNPQLVKVVLTWVGPTDKTLKIFLKNGKVVEIKSDKINNLESVSAAALIQLAARGARK